MKRLSAILLSLILLFSLTGAGQPVLGGDPEPTADPGITTEALFSLGTINGDVYENPYIGYGCKLEGWTYADAEYIATINNLSGSVMSSDVQEALKKAGNFTEMFATSPDQLSTINIQYQDISSTYGEVFNSYPLESVLEFAAPSVASIMEQSGYSDVKAETGVVNLGGDDHPGLIISSTYSSIPCYQKEACLKTDDYMIFVCVTSFVTDKTDELLSYFYRLEDANVSATADAETEIVCFSPKEELDFAVRYDNPDWTYEFGSEGVSFTNTAAAQDTCQMELMTMDMTGMEGFAEYVLDIVMASMKSELVKQFEEIEFSEPSETIVGGKYNGRSVDMLITVPLLGEKMNAYMTAWATDSMLYMLVAYSVESELDNTLSMYSQLLSSFETADEYLARTGSASLEPAA